MSRWTHPICSHCYATAEPGRVPHVVSDPHDQETCCFCGATTTEGIYYRADPAGLRCRGEH